MALDEALLLSMSRLEVPVLRFYAWIERAASFGYFQKYSQVEMLTPLRPLVRRPTAGGLVPHDADWTYSLTFPASHEWYSTRALESYRRVHDWLRAAFLSVGLHTELAPASQPSGPGQCFVGFEQYDLLCRGRKIAGAAQRRTRVGLLIQGSVQPPSSELHRDSWEQAMRTVAQEQLGFETTTFDDAPLLLVCTRRLEQEKYALASYNQKR
jgi:lipoyl(octanoyl) transferase